MYMDNEREWFCTPKFLNAVKGWSQVSADGCFRQYLYMFGHNADPTCPYCCSIEETTEQALLKCQRVDNEKSKIQEFIQNTRTHTTLSSNLSHRRPNLIKLTSFLSRIYYCFYYYIVIYYFVIKYPKLYLVTTQMFSIEKTLTWKRGLKIGLRGPNIPKQIYKSLFPISFYSKFLKYDFVVM